MKAKKRRSTLKTSPSSGSLAWLLTGFLVGASTVGWITINKDISLSDIIPVKSHPKNTTLSSTAPTATETKPKQPKFDFYTVLTENESIVSPAQDQNAEASRSTSIEATAKTESPPAQAALSSETETTAPPLPKTLYVLQIASFKTLSDADELKARLALKGIQVTIQSVKLKNGETWHRVRTQPLDSLQAAEIQKEKFQQQNIRSLILKLDN